MSGASGPMVTDQTPSLPLVSGDGFPSSSPFATTSRALGARYRSVIVRSVRTSGDTICGRGWAKAGVTTSAQPNTEAAVILIISHLDEMADYIASLPPAGNGQQKRDRCAVD